jgi:hypothetical protein
MQRLIGTAEKFKEVDWSDIYPDAAKDLPPNARQRQMEIWYKSIALWMQTTQETR